MPVALLMSQKMTILLKCGKIILLACITQFETKFYERVATTNDISCLYITRQNVATSCRQQKKDKSAGPDGLHMEAFVFGCSHLYVFKRMEACYNKCIKSFFKYRRLGSVTDMLSELGLTTFSDLFYDNVAKFKIRLLMAGNDAIRHFTSAFVGRM